MSEMKKPMKNMQDIKTEINVNGSDFGEKVIEQSKKVPVVVDFWAQWCMPCLILSPTLEKLAKEHDGRFVLAKLNVDGNQEIAQRYGIMSIPAVKMFRDGKIVDEFVGALGEDAVRQWLDNNLKSGS